MTDKVLPIAFPDLTLDSVIAHWAKVTPERFALMFEPSIGEDPVTWREFEDYVQGCAEVIGDTISSGDAVGLVCDDAPEFHILVNALWRCGAGVLLINRTWGDAVVADLLNLVDTDVLFSPGAQEEDERYPNCVVRGFPSRRRAADIIPCLVGDPDAIAIYATTSGTTDDPKCVPITHRQIRSAYRACLEVRDFARVRKAASLFPLNGLGVLGVCFLLPREIGAGTYVFPPFTIATISRSWKSLFTQRVDFVYLVPALVRLLNSLDIPIEDESQAMAFCAAAPVAESDLRRFEEKYPIIVYNAYGLTELTFAVFFGCRTEDGKASDSIGYPLGVEARIFDEMGRPVDEGELYLRGPMLTEGYLHNATSTAKMWTDDGWLKTGDLARRDTEGRYYICGRIKEAVIRGGILYYLHELEHYFRQAPGVIDVCAFKGRDMPSGDELCAVVHVDDGVERTPLLQWLKENVGKEKIPNTLFFWRRELPRNSNGKIMRKELAAMHIEGHLGDEGI